MRAGRPRDWFGPRLRPERGGKSPRVAPGFHRIPGRPASCALDRRVALGHLAPFAVPRPPAARPQCSGLPLGPLRTSGEHTRPGRTDGEAGQPLSAASRRGTAPRRATPELPLRFGARPSTATCTSSSAPIPQTPRKAAVDAVMETLASRDYAGRHVLEGVGYLGDPWENAALYMTGCKSAVVILDGRDGGLGRALLSTRFPPGPGREGTRALGSLDPRRRNLPLPPVWPCPWAGLTSIAYDAGEDHLSVLRGGVTDWLNALEGHLDP